MPSPLPPFVPTVAVQPLVTVSARLRQLSWPRPSPCHGFVLLLLWLSLGMTSFPALQAAAPLPTPGTRHHFEIGSEQFLLDGQPFVIRCGELHFPRIPREYWAQRLRQCHALGLNTVCVYVFWNYHEWEQGRFNWSGNADVAEFCRLAQAEGLWVLLRPGPYSCAEWEMGGLPWWLLRDPHPALRTSDPRFLEPAKRYLCELGRQLAPLQVTRGGPLLMVQVENEYGSFGKDADYMGALRQALLDGGFEVPLFACNPAGAIPNGYRSDLFQVVNFGAGSAQRAFETLRKYQTSGPLMNGEYYPAWFDIWGRRHRTGPAQPIVDDVEYMLSHGHSFSIYMAHGGTSFGLWAGADRPFLPDTSSYDYDAPVSEAGGTTPKFEAIRQVLLRHLQPGEQIPEAVPAPAVIRVADFRLTRRAALLDQFPAPLATDGAPRPLEEFNLGRGLLCYECELAPGDAGTLNLGEVHDFGWAFLEGQAVGVLDRRTRRFSLTLPARSKPARLQVVVEAMGRVNFGQEVADHKGLLGKATWLEAGGQARELAHWSLRVMPLEAETLASLRYAETSDHRLGPAVWQGSFDLSSTGDTFLDLSHWGKGVVWLNGHCLGRFWNIGPTQTQYVPAPWLKAGRNEILVLDLIGPEDPVLSGLDRPILDELRLERDFARSTRANGHPNLAPSAQLLAAELDSGTAWQERRAAQTQSGRYVALQIASTYDDSEQAALAEVDLLDGEGRSLPKTSWKILWVDSEELNVEPGYAENILDGQPNTSWITRVAGGKTPHTLVIDLGSLQSLGGVRVLQRAGNAQTKGRIRKLDIQVSPEPFGLSQ